MNRKGFTLVEILAVVALIAVISVAAILAVTSVINKQRVRTATLSENNINEAALSIQSQKHNLYLPACVDKTSGTYVNISEMIVKKINDDLRDQMNHDGKTTREQKDEYIKNYVKNINTDEAFKRNFSNAYLGVKDINCFKATSVTDMIKEGYLKDLDNGCDTSTLIIIYNKGDSANTAGNLKAVQETGICKGSESEEKGPLITVTPEKDLKSTAKKTVKITATADESKLESNLVLKYGWSKSLRKKPASWETVNLVGNRTKVSAEVSKTGADEEFYLWIAAGSVKDNKGYSNVTFATGPYAFLPTPMIIYASRNYDETFNDRVRGHNRCNGEETCHDKTKAVVYSKPYGRDVDGYIENLCVPSCRGYAFTGWKYNDLNINNNSIVGDRNNHTLTATYTPKTYTVTYNSNGGNACSPSNKTVTYDKPYGALCVTTRVGYEFMGWWTTEDGGTKITDTSIYTVDSNQTIYAHWKAKNYTVLLNSTGATTPGSPSTVVTYDDNRLNPVPNSPSKTYTVYFNTNGTGATANATSKTSNYNFDGWFTAASGGTKVIGSDKELVNSASGYIQSGKWKRDGGATLYSQFSGGAITLSSINKPGYTCRWYQDSLGTIGARNPDSSYTPTTDITFYAKCTPNKYKIVYKANGGSGTIADTECTYDSDCSLSNQSFSKTGYTNSAWSKSENASADYGKGATVRNLATGGTYTLYAYWSKNSYTVAFDGNGGTNPTSISIKYNEKIGTLPTSSRTNYNLDGWYTAKTGGNKISIDTLVTGDVTYYAHWTIKSYTVSFDGNGGTDPTSITKKYNEKIGELPTSSRTNYNFDGWFTTTTGGSKITSNTLVTANVTYYAHWTRVYTITWKAGKWIPSEHDNKGKEKTGYIGKIGVTELKKTYKVGDKAYGPTGYKFGDTDVSNKIFMSERIFDGWEKDGFEVTKDETVNAKWEISSVRFIWHIKGTNNKYGKLDKKNGPDIPEKAVNKDPCLSEPREYDNHTNPRDYRNLTHATLKMIPPSNYVATKYWYNGEKYIKHSITDDNKRPIVYTLLKADDLATLKKYGGIPSVNMYPVWCPDDKKVLDVSNNNTTAKCKKS